MTESRELRRRRKLFNQLLETLGVSTGRFAEFLEVEGRTVRRWGSDPKTDATAKPAPTNVLILLALMVKKRVSLDEARKLIGLDKLPPYVGPGRRPAAEEDNDRA